MVGQRGQIIARALEVAAVHIPRRAWQARGHMHYQYTPLGQAHFFHRVQVVQDLYGHAVQLGAAW